MIPESRVILTLEKGVRFIIGSISIQIQQIMSIIPSGFVISARSIIVCKLWIGKKKAWLYLPLKVYKIVALLISEEYVVS